jgi:hypothetical protein
MPGGWQALRHYRVYVLPTMKCSFLIQVPCRFDGPDTSNEFIKLFCDALLSWETHPVSDDATQTSVQRARTFADIRATHPVCLSCNRAYDMSVGTA